MKYLVQLLKIMMLVAVSTSFVTSTATFASDDGAKAEQGDKAKDKKKKGKKGEEPECD